MGEFYTTGGWTCGVCGAYVINNTTHVCIGPSTYPPYIPAPVLLEAETDPIILEKLNEIIKLLKEIRRK